jgi:hypothetical protein
MTTENARRADRVTVNIPVEVSGSDATGQVFFERTITLVLSRNGATILLNRKLIPEQELLVRNLQNQREAEGHVVGYVARHEKGDVYGITFTDKTLNIWEIEFPSAKEANDAAFHLVMACTRCKSRQVAYLDEMEAEVYRGSGALMRRCNICRDSTVWRESSVVAAPAGGQAPVLPDAPKPYFDAAAPVKSKEDKETEEEESTKPRAPRTVNDRKHVRSRMQIEVCVRRIRAGSGEWTGEEEVELTEDCSRGGFSFYCNMRFKRGERVEVAIPYRRDGANIFVTASIANVRKQKDGRYRYGVAYVRGMR